jgi:RNA polymerase sigma factor (sigma-70 family)
MCKLDERQRALAENNIGLVYFVLKKMGVSRSFYDYDGLVEAGYAGLCNAARVWREGRSAFSTFAFIGIKHEVLAVLKARGLDRRRLTPLDTVHEYIPSYDCGLEEAEAGILTEEFCRCASQNLGETSLAVMHLSISGKNCVQIAKILGISLSAVEKAKRKARIAVEGWLRDWKG